MWGAALTPPSPRGRKVRLGQIQCPPVNGGKEEVSEFFLHPPR